MIDDTDAAPVLDMSRTPEQSPAPALVAPAAPELVPGSPAHAVWHWWNTQVAGKADPSRGAPGFEAHVLEQIPALISSLEQKD